MSKILISVSNLEEINETKNLVDGYIIGIKNLCVTSQITIEPKKISLLSKYNDKDLFILLNKNMHNSDLTLLKDVLIELNNYKIKGVIYYDVSVLSIYNSLNLDYDLVWNQEHAVTNYNSINYWNSFGVNYAYISNDITENEIKEIKNNCNCKIILNLFGYVPMFVSKRHIVKNYLDYFNIEDNSRVNYIEKESKVYPIIDSDIGTQVYSNNIVNGIKSYLNIKPDYVVLNSFNINMSFFVKVLIMFKNVNFKNVNKYYEDINSMFHNIDECFLHTETIYKVKNEKK